MTDEREWAAVRVVLTTAGSPEDAERIATAVVEEGLAACANLVPGVISVFRWEGALQREAEVLVVLKTTAAGVDRLIERIADLHPYDVPEALALDVGAGHEPYLAWVAGEVGGR